MPIAMYWMHRILWIRLLASLELLLMIDGLSTTTPHVAGNEGSEVTLICNRDGGPGADVIWQFHAMLHATSDNDPVYIAAVSLTGVFMPDRTTPWADDISSTGTSHLVIHRLRLDRDEGYFMCSLGLNYITIKVTVLVPVRAIDQTPAGTVTLSTTQVDATTFTCTATSKPVATVTWERVNATDEVILSGATEREIIIEDLAQVISTLSYTPQKEHDGDKIRCSVINIAMTSSVVSSDAKLIIYYPPDFVRAISGYTHPVTESSTEPLHMTCSTNGVPNPKTLVYTWSSDCGTDVPDVTVTVISSIVTEGGNTQLECHPSAVPDIYTYIAWTQTVNGVRVRDLTGSRSLNLNNLAFENSGEYRCTVNNTVGTGTGSGSVTIKYASKLVEVGNFSAGMNDTATVSLKFIGNPRPNVTWHKDGSNYSLDANVIKFSTNIVHIHVSWIFYKTPVTIPGYEATLTIHSVQEQDYTAYHATLDNGLKTGSQIPRFSAHLIPMDTPQRPSYFKAICDVTTAVVFWVPQFDGGLTQTFHLSYLNNGQRVSISEHDPGKGNPGIVKLETLEAGRNYAFAIFAKNSLGARETVHTSCQTKEIVVSLPPISPEADSSTLVAAVAVAVPLVCIIIVLIIVICIVLRRQKLQANEPNMDVAAMKNAITLSAVASTPPEHMEDDKDAPNDEIHNTYDTILNENYVTLYNDINQYNNPALRNDVSLQTASLDKDGGNLHVVPALAHPTSSEQNPGARSNTEPREYETTSFGDGAVQYKNTRSEAEERCYEKLKPTISTESSNLNDSPYENKMVNPRIVYENV